MFQFIKPYKERIYSCILLFIFFHALRLSHKKRLTAQWQNSAFPVVPFGPLVKLDCHLNTELRTMGCYEHSGKQSRETESGQVRPSRMALLRALEWHTFIKQFFGSSHPPWGPSPALLDCCLQETGARRKRMFPIVTMAPLIPLPEQALIPSACLWSA